MKINHAIAAASAVTVLLLAGCSASPEEPTAEAPSVEPAGPTETPTPTPEPAEEGPAESERGNLIKTVGDTFGFGNTVDSESVATFRVTGITVDPSCTGEWATDPENGHFVRFDIEGEVLPEAEYDMLFAGWKLIAENGTTYNGSLTSAAAFSCLNDEEVLPTIVGAGERVAGSVVLDVPSATGTVILPLNGITGWEWSFPQ